MCEKGLVSEEGSERTAHNPQTACANGVASCTCASKAQGGLLGYCPRFAGVLAAPLPAALQR